jgi:hypothetical protein
MARQSSTSSHISQSPSDAPHKAAPKRQHVVGHSRVQRNASSKNLTKLNKPNQPRGDDGNAVKHHRRSHSGNSTSAPSSPRPSFKRNASSGAVVRATNTHGHTAIRKNFSSGHLARQQAKPALKSSKSEVAVQKRSLINPDKARQSPSSSAHAVHFDVGEDDEDGPDDGWTEESASQSPTTTRSNTRSNSVIMDAHRTTSSGPENAGEASQTEANLQRSQALPSTATHTQILPDRTNHTRLGNGTGAHHHHSRPPDADMITSRLLQRSSQHNAPPQTSTIAATVVASHNNIRELSQSAGSTLVDTPGRDLVSRFMDGEGSAGTTNNSSFLPSRDSPQSSNVEQLDRIKRNRSMPNVAGAETPARAPSRRSGTSTPTDLPVSRTQQKLMLQRASSNIEPQKLVPVILPRTGGPTAYLHSGMTYSANGEGRLDPRLQQQFNQVAVEYNVVRRYRNPIADALARIEQIPGTPRKTRVPKSGSTNGSASAHGSASTSFNDETERRRARVSFENGERNRGEGDQEGRQSFDSDRGSIRNEAEEICRRLWESAEAVEHD